MLRPWGYGSCMLIVPSALLIPEGSKIRASSGQARSGHSMVYQTPLLTFTWRAAEIFTYHFIGHLFLYNLLPNPAVWPILSWLSIPVSALLCEASPNLEVLHNHLFCSQFCESGIWVGYAKMVCLRSLGHQLVASVSLTCSVSKWHLMA